MKKAEKENAAAKSQGEEILFREEHLADLLLISLDPEKIVNSLFESTQYDREFKGSTKNSEATRQENLDEIKAR
jgi:hypothetical protein